MSILTAVQRAYDVMVERKWDTVYWCVDLHGTVLESNYSSKEYSFLGDDVVTALQMISDLPETRIILWSSIHKADEANIRKLFADHDINVHYVNENPEVPNTDTGNFERKFYFSVLVDDKAGFTPDQWMPTALLAEQLSTNARL